MIFKNANESIWDHYKYDSLLGVDKKTKKPIKLEKNNWKNRVKPKNRAKSEKTEPNQFLSWKTELNRNRLVWTGFEFFYKKYLI